MNMDTRLELCRLCMSQNNLLNKKDDSHFLERVYECIKIKIQPNNEYLPTTICFKCERKVEDFCQFQRKCLRVQSLLWRMQQEHYNVELASEDTLSEDNDGIVDEQMKTGLDEEYEEQIEVLKLIDAAEPDETEQIQLINVVAINGTDLKIDESEYLDDPSLPAPINPRSIYSCKQSRDEKQIYRSLLQECEICGKKVEKTRLNGHLNRHQGLKPYACSDAECGARFPCKIALRLHRNNRHSTQQYACGLCSKVCKSMKNLNHHKYTHHSKSILMCGICNMTFKNNAQLTRHKVIHSEDRKFSCAICTKSFHRKGNLAVHMRTHTKERPYPCTLCPKSFGYTRVLKEHMLRIHKDSLASE